jgi:RNA polymerase sigma-70 factor (ECF subfamily)
MFDRIPMTGDAASTAGGGGRSFPTTRWTLLRSAGQADSETARRSIEEFALLYWRPVYAYFRAKWRQPDAEARDLTQDFFAALIEKEFLGTLSPEHGRFRSYVMASLDNLVRLRHRSEGRLKRGGGAVRLSLHAVEGFEPAADADPAREFLREWGAALMEQALAEMERDARAQGKETEFQVFRLHDVDAPPGTDLSYEALARRFGISVTDVTHFLYRARQKMREVVLRHVCDTVTTPDEAEAEMRELFGNP